MFCLVLQTRQTYSFFAVFSKQCPFGDHVEFSIVFLRFFSRLHYLRLAPNVASRSRPSHEAVLSRKRRWSGSSFCGDLNSVKLAMFSNVFLHPPLQRVGRAISSQTQSFIVHSIGDDFAGAATVSITACRSSNLGREAKGGDGCTRETCGTVGGQIAVSNGFSASSAAQNRLRNTPEHSSRKLLRMIFHRP